MVMKPISCLPLGVVNRIRSATVIRDVAQVVEELSSNSIDGGAKAVKVTVDSLQSIVKVEDDGCGVSRDDLGLLGERHATSKLQSISQLEQGVSSLGFKGEALSSISDVALVEVTTRTPGSPHTYCKIMKGGKTLSLGLSKHHRPAGTTVVVRDLFYNQAVRRRLLHSSWLKDVQEIKERIVRLAAIHPNVSFTLTDASRHLQVLHTKRTASATSTLQDLFGGDFVNGMQEIDMSKQQLRLSGFLSRMGYGQTSKALQYLYINGRFVARTPLHKLLNGHFGSLVDVMESGSQDARQNEDHTWKRTRTLGRACASARNRYPAFVLDLQGPHASYDITFEAAKTHVEFKDWQPVLAFVREVICSMWGDTLILSASPRPDERPPLEVEATLKSPLKRRGTSWQKTDPTWQPRRKLEMPLQHAPRRAEDGHVHCVPNVGDFLSPCKSPVGGYSLRPRHHKLDTQGLDHTDRCKPSKASPSAKGWQMSPCGKDGNGQGTIFVGLLDGMEASPVQQFGFNSPGRVPWSPTNIDGHVPMVEVSPISTFESPAEVAAASRRFPALRRDMLLNLSSRSPDFDMSWDRGLALKGHLFSPRSRLEDEGDAFSDDVDKFVDRQGNLFSEFSQRRENDAEPSTRHPVWSDSDDSIASLEFRRGSHSRGRRRKQGVYLEFEGDRGEIRQKRTVRSKGGGGLSAASKDWSPLSTNWDEVQVDNIGKEKDRQWHTSKQERHVCPVDSDAELIATESQVGAYKLTPVSGKQALRSLDQEVVASPRCMGDSNGVGRVEAKDVVEALHGYTDRRPCSSGMERSICSSGMERSIHGSGEVMRKDAAVHGTGIGVQRRKQSRRRMSAPPHYKGRQLFGVHGNPEASLRSSAGITEEIGARLPEGSEAHTKGLQASKVGGGGAQQQEEGVKSCEREGADIGSGQPANMKAHERCEGGLTLTAKPTSAGECCSSKWRAPQPADGLPSSHKGQGDAETIAGQFKAWQNPCLRQEERIILDVSRDLSAGYGGSLIPQSISRETFEQAQVLQQIDKKFIATVASGTLIIVDQHAADERVRLEELREQVLNEEQHKSSLLDRPIEMAVTMTEEQMLVKYRARILHWGWRFKITAGAASRAPSQSAAACKVLLSAVPCILGVNLAAADLVDYLHQLTETHGSSTPPPAVQRVLNSKSCRGAIMFGDSLSPIECRQLIQQLKTTQLSFQCAHGRPTMVPLVDLKALSRRFLRPSVQQEGLLMGAQQDVENKWMKHGRKEDGAHRSLSLERAEQRLGQAQEMLALLTG